MNARENRFLLGYGERLTRRVNPPQGGRSVRPPYSPAEVITRLTPMLTNLSLRLDSLPDSACPDGEAVASVTVHPQWLAKTAYPNHVLALYGLRQVGSRPAIVTPEKWSRRTDPAPSPSAELFLAGDRENFRRWRADIAGAPAEFGRGLDEQMARLELVRAPEPSDRLRVPDSRDGELFVEAVLHAHDSDAVILDAFDSFARGLEAEVFMDRRLQIRGLCFIPMQLDAQRLDALAQFAFLRVARPLPRMRKFGAIERSTPTGHAECKLPVEDALDPSVRAVVFDGGLLAQSALSRWVRSIEPVGIGAHVDDYAAHGHDVTSALLFGSLIPGEPAPRPFGYVDHVRVLDGDSSIDPFELYETLGRIDDTLRTGEYEFANLSLGPPLCVEDDEVHSWTALLDDFLSSGDVLATVAVGNISPEVGDRVQVPGDAVNALSVGAADSQKLGWARAPYSAVGPGRAPGVIKPDLLAFGGDSAEPFFVYGAAGVPGLAVTTGTSFASPSALRLAMGVRAHFGDRYSALGLRALLVHGCAPGVSVAEAGWGRLPAGIDELVTCQDGAVRVIYQGELTPAKYLRAPLPVPTSVLAGDVTISATFCYATPTDPENPGSYTKAGLDIVFRPHDGKFKNQSTEPATAPFFRRGQFQTEAELRSDAHKWETTLSGTKKMRATSLLRPMFDIHYNARDAGAPSPVTEKMRYALVVTIKAPRVPDIYDEVVRSFAGRLEPFRPVIDIAVRT